MNRARLDSLSSPASALSDDAIDDCTLSRLCTFRLPATVHFGIGAVSQVVEVLKEMHAKRPLVIGGTRAVAAFRKKTGAGRLAGDFTWTYAAAVRREPSVDDTAEMLRFAEHADADVVIGIGGGSAMDVAKAVAALLRTGLTFAQIVGTDKVPPRSVRVICVPTTAGSGSEVSPNSVLVDKVSRVKLAAISPQLVPDAAIVDPTLTCGLPADVTGETGIDALSHCIEAVVNRHAHPITDHVALRGVSLIAAHLPTAVESGEDLAARTGVAMGSLLGGMCLGPVNTTAVHALSYPLQGICGVPHGLANAILLAHVLQFNAAVAIDQCAAVATALGATEDRDHAHLAQQAAPRVSELLHRCRIPSRLRDLGINSAQIPELARSAMTVTRLLDRNPRAVTYSDVIAIYQEAY